MLEKQDLQAIRGVINEAIDVRVPTIVRMIVKEEITINNVILLDEVDKRIHSAIEENNPKIISAVAEMLEDNVFPQFAEIHRELRILKTVAGWQA